MKKDLFDLTGKIALITGAGGLLGQKHAEAILEYGGSVILTDIIESSVLDKAQAFNKQFGEDKAFGFYMDVTKKETIQNVVDKFNKIDILINNAAKDPKVKQSGGLTPDSKFETMSEEYWFDGIGVTMNGTFLCSQVIINKMLKTGGGVILNIASDLAVIAPDQRIYRKEGISEEQQNVKPITYSASKWAIVGMTKYLASYFAKNNIRVNCISPAGIYNNQPEEFVEKLSNLIPMGRMAEKDECKGAVVFLCSDASSFVTGHNLIIDGGRSII